MKTILKKPNYEMRCPCCGCHFAFEIDDLNCDHNLDKRAKWVKCPHCEENIKIRDNDMILFPMVKVRFKDESSIDVH